MIMPLYSKSHVIAILLDHLNVNEYLTQTFDHAEERAFDEDLLGYFIHPKLPLQFVVQRFVFVFFARLAKLIQVQNGFDDETWNLGLCHDLSGFLCCQKLFTKDFLKFRCLKSIRVEQVRVNLLDIILSGNLGLNFNDKARTELVFDMLWGAKTLEDSSFDHDAHLG